MYVYIGQNKCRTKIKSELFPMGLELATYEFVVQ